MTGALSAGRGGVGTLRLVRDVQEPSQHMSFAPWESIEAIHAWKSSPELKERIGRVKRRVDEFTASELELVTAVERTRSPVEATAYATSTAQSP